MAGIVESVANLAGKVIEKISPDKAESRAQQAEINREELAGAGQSKLRLWRPFLGWSLSILMVWEIAGRTIILTYWPDTVLPPSMISEVKTILLGMLGLGF
jgi:hypothetical protein